MDRIEWMIEKAVEIGINEISFFTSTNSERTTIKLDRIQKIVESAVKQSLQAFIPKINNLISFNDFLLKSTNDQKFIAHCNDGEKMDIQTIKFKNESSIIVIGPEGDFTKDEVISAIQNTFVPIRLGTNRLRTETAGLYVCQAVSILSSL